MTDESNPETRTVAPKRRPNIRLTPDEAWAFIASAHTGVFTTLRRDGMPIATPTWFVAIDQRVFISTPASAKKVLRVQHDSRASFLVESGERWAELMAVHLTGHASLIDDPELAAQVSAMSNEKYQAFRTPRREMPSSAKAKYSGQSALISFTPDERILSWDNSRLSS